jgi:hypothetical protein
MQCSTIRLRMIEKNKYTVIPLKAARANKTVGPFGQRPAVSYLGGQLYHWHHSPLVSGVIFTVHHWPATLLTPPATSQRCYNHCPTLVCVSLSLPTTVLRCYYHYPPLFSGVIITAHHWSAVSLSLPTTGQRCYWHFPPRSAVSFLLSTNGQRCYSHLPPLVSGVIVTAQLWSAHHCHCPPLFSSVIVTAHHWSAVL